MWIMRLFDPWRLSSDLAALKSQLGSLEILLNDVKAGAARELAHQVVELEARIARETLSWTELYDKTYHLQKRIEQRKRDAVPIPEEPPRIVDQITERVRARRNRKETGG